MFALVGAHAPDCCFEYCYLPDLPKAAAALLDAPDAAAWLEGARRRARETKLGGSDHAPLNVVAMAAHYSPRAGAPLGLELPFELPTGRLRDDVWARWLEHDPVRFVPRAADGVPAARGGLPRLRDARRVQPALGSADGRRGAPGARGEVEHQEFEDGHMGTSYRYDASLRYLVPRLAEGVSAAGCRSTVDLDLDRDRDLDLDLDRDRDLGEGNGRPEAAVGFDSDPRRYSRGGCPRRRNAGMSY